MSSFVKKKKKKKKKFISPMRIVWTKKPLIFLIYYPIGISSAGRKNVTTRLRIIGKVKTELRAKKGDNSRVAIFS